ncbi:MAG: hypothetical protein QOD72_2326 [Acidimicrobiaceae bacterium]|jgi:hypothetical protein|nr:hypothetical protein [Acidimicrobiaceae bacterium]
MTTLQGQATISIASQATVVYDLIADVTTMSQWSPECVRCEWLDEPGHVGSRFRGHNRRGPLRWKTIAQVVAAERGRVFAFTTMHRDRESTRWRYELRATPNGTEVVESFEAIHVPQPIRIIERVFMPNRQRELIAGMHVTLERIRAAAEPVPRH